MFKIYKKAEVFFRSFFLLLIGAGLFFAFQNFSMVGAKRNLLFKKAQSCLIKQQTLSEFRSCVKSVAQVTPPSSAKLSHCYFGFESKADALNALPQIVDDTHSIGVVQFTEGSACREAFPEAYLLMTEAEFSANKEALYTLPLSYTEARSAIKRIVSTFRQKYLDIPINEKKRENQFTCNGTVQLSDWNGPRDWITLAYAAELFRSGSIIFQNDYWAPQLSENLKTAFVDLADHILTNANAIQFPDIKNSESLIGWNNLASSWDAWKNGTCSSAGQPNAWATGWSLKVLADAYLITKNGKYLNGFRNGSLFFHTGESSSFLPSAPNLNEIKKKAAAYGPYTISSTYTVGGSRFSPLSGQDPSQLVIRYHYYAEDPGRFTINDTGIMSLAMITAGLGSPNSKYFIADGKGGAIPRTFSNIGYFGMYGVYGNIKYKNYSYQDLDDIKYTSSDYEGHVDFSIYYLAKAGTLLKNRYYVEAAKSAVKDLVDHVPASKKQANGLYITCLNRQLDPKIASACRQLMSNIETKGLLSLFAALALLQ